MLVPLVRMLSDSAERCRELSLGIIAESLARLPEPSLLLPAVIPVLAARLGAAPAQVTADALSKACGTLFGMPETQILEGQTA